MYKLQNHPELEVGLDSGFSCHLRIRKCWVPFPSPVFQRSELDNILKLESDNCIYQSHDHQKKLILIAFISFIRLFFFLLLVFVYMWVCKIGCDKIGVMDLEKFLFNLGSMPIT